MLIISHRGLLEGPDPSLENTPAQIEKAINHGFHVEIDIRYLNDKWYLGHDAPTTEFEFPWLYSLSPNRWWLHAKDIYTLNHLVDYLGDNLQFFYHDKDDVALTSGRYLWTFPNKSLTKRSIAVLPETIVGEWDNLGCAMGICTDYPIKYHEMFNR